MLTTAKTQQKKKFDENRKIIKNVKIQKQK